MSHTAVVLVLLLDSVFFYSGSKNGLKGNIKMQFKKKRKSSNWETKTVINQHALMPVPI